MSVAVVNGRINVVGYRGTLEGALHPRSTWVSQMAQRGKGKHMCMTVDAFIVTVLLA